MDNVAAASFLSRASLLMARSVSKSSPLLREGPARAPILARHTSWSRLRPESRVVAHRARPSRGTRGDTHGCDVNDVTVSARLNTSARRRYGLTSAEARPAIERHRVGHGFVSEETTRAYLEQFNGADLLRLFGTGRIDSRFLQSASKTRIADQVTLSSLLRAWRRSKLKWAVDLTDFTDRERPPLVVLGPIEHPQ